jgi:hypothetical protein
MLILTLGLLYFFFLVLNVVALPPIAIKGVHWARDKPKFVYKVDDAMHPTHPSTTWYGICEHAIM